MFVCSFSSTNNEYICVHALVMILLKLCLLSILFKAAPLEPELFIYLVFDKWSLTLSYQGFMLTSLIGNSILLIVAVSKTTQKVILPPGYFSWVWYRPCFITTCNTGTSLIVLPKTYDFFFFFFFFHFHIHSHIQGTFKRIC